MTKSFNIVDQLLAKGFRTQRKLAIAAEVKGQSTVGSWKQENRIPYERMRLILINAADMGIELYPDDFFEPELRSEKGLVITG